MSTFQKRIQGWMMNVFSNEICRDIQERNHRFLEEALELVQSLGCTKEEAEMLIKYTFNRPIGEPKSEVGGVMVTLAALCNPAEIDMMGEAEKELLRISSPEMIKKIQNKQATKPKHSPLPAELTEDVDNFPELTEEQNRHWEEFVCSHGLSMYPLDIDKFEFTGARVKQLLHIASQNSPNNFNFYDNTLAVSFANPSGNPKAEMKSDFALAGNSLYLINGLIEQMERHPELAEVITNAAYNYLQRNKV